jgi:hypothetical protein
MLEIITKEGLIKLGFTKQDHGMNVTDGILFDIWRKKWLCVFESRESNLYQFRIVRDMDYILIKEVFFINEIELLYEAITGESCIDKQIPNLNERLSNVKSTLQQMLDYSFDEQRGIADFVESNTQARNTMNRLAKESEVYQKFIKKISNSE